MQIFLFSYYRHPDQWVKLHATLITVDSTVRHLAAIAYTLISRHSVLLLSMNSSARSPFLVSIHFQNHYLFYYHCFIIIFYFDHLHPSSSCTSFCIIIITSWMIYFHDHFVTIISSFILSVFINATFLVLLELF